MQSFVTREVSPFETIVLPVKKKHLKHCVSNGLVFVVCGPGELSQVENGGNWALGNDTSVFGIVLIQWFSTFFVPRPIIATHYNPTTPI